jgi:hypothetical protein
MSFDIHESPPICEDRLAQAPGTRFGFDPSRRATMAAITSQPSDPPAAFAPRQRDRRRALTDLLSAVTRGLDRRADLPLMRGAFEETLRRILAVRAVQLREAGSRWTMQAEGGSGAESIALEVPGSDGTLPHVLEATFDPGCCLGEWDFQVLGLAAHIGAFILEIERSRTQLVRAGLMPNGRPRRDGAAPLIGSATVMQALRATIERVAITDFTVLLEGSSDPQQ